MMLYELAHQTYATKQDVTKRCQTILHNTPEGQLVGPADLAFLLAIFAFHTEWDQKAAGGIAGITTAISEHYGTRYFVLLCANGTISDISYPHAIKQMPSSRSKNLLPQPLIDFRNAARAAIRNQIDNYRAHALNPGQTHCALSGANLAAETNRLHVDHIPPLTFDRLLYDFCLLHNLNPLKARVIEVDTVPVIVDPNTEKAWQEHHHKHAKLRLVARDANLGLSKVKVKWDETFHNGHGCIPVQSNEAADAILRPLSRALRTHDNK